MLPIVLDLDSYRRPASPVVRRLYDDGRTNILFVGRIIPNKKIDDLIRVFALYQRLFDRHSRLLLVGDYRGHEKYYDRLQELARARGRGGGRLHRARWTTTSCAPPTPSADLFLCLSEHEGFCVPLLEAMAFDVPVVAYDAGAVRETLRGGGVLLRDKDAGGRWPALVRRVLTDEALRVARARDAGARDGGGARHRLRRAPPRPPGPVLERPPRRRPCRPGPR